MKGGKIGPYQTDCETFDRGTRKIEVTLSAKGVYYRLKGKREEYFLPHATGYMRALSIAADIDLGPRKGRIRRSSMGIQG
jgi:hypothetical protein